MQSYFVHWAGIESPVVVDQSRGPGSGSNVTSVDEWNSASVLREDEVGPFPGAHLRLWLINTLQLKLAKVSGKKLLSSCHFAAFEVQMLLNRLRDMATGQSMTVESTARTSGTTQSYGTQETPTAFVLSASESSPPLASASLGDFYLEVQNGPENSSGLFGPQQKEVTKGSSTNRQEASDRGTSGLPLPTVQSSKSPVPFLPTKDSMRRQKEEKTTSQGPHLSSVPARKGKLHQESTTEIYLLKNIYRSNSAGSTPQNPGGPAPQTDPLGSPSKSWIKSDSGLIKEEIKINNPSVPQAQNPHPNTSNHDQTPAHRSAGQQQTPPTPISHLPTVTDQNIPFYKASSSQTSSQYPTKPPTLNSTFAEVQPSPREQTLPQSTTPGDSFYETTHSPSQTSQIQSFGRKQTQTLGTPQTILTQRVYPSPTLGNVKKVNPSPPSVKIAKANSASTPSVPPLSPLDSLLYSRTSSVSAASLDHPRLTTSPHPPGSSTVVSKQEFLSHESISLAPTTRNRPKTSPAPSSLPSPSPISTPPQIPLVQPSSSSSILASSFTQPLDSSHDPSPVQVRMTSPSSTTSQYATHSSFWTGSSATISPTPSSSATKHSFFTPTSSVPALPHSSSSITTSTHSTFSMDSMPTTSLLMSSGSTSPDPAPSQVHRRALSQPFTSTSSSVPSQQLTTDQGLLFQSPSAPSESQPKLKNISTPTMMVHPNPEPYPNFDPHLKANINEIVPNPPNTDTETEHPTNPARTPGRDGKYPGVVPRRTSWELGMLLGCSAGLGMVLVVGLRYIYSQACGKRTRVTLNDREREHARGERGLIHVQECGDLVRVRRIRDNSFVLLAEYDILGSPGD